MRGNLLWRPKRAPSRSLKKADWEIYGDKKSACFSANKGRRSPKRFPHAPSKKRKIMRGNLLWRPKKAPSRSIKKADWVKAGNKKPACFSANCIQNLLRMHPPSPTPFPSSHFSAIIAA